MQLRFQYECKIHKFLREYTNTIFSFNTSFDSRQIDYTNVNKLNKESNQLVTPIILMIQIVIFEGDIIFKNKIMGQKKILSQIFGQLISMKNVLTSSIT